MEFMADDCHTGGSSLGPPSLYDTSTSTVDSHSSSSARCQHNLSNPSLHSAFSSSRTSENKMTPNHNYQYGQQQRQSGTYSTSKPRFPRVRKTMSEPGVSTEYDRYIQKKSFQFIAPASEVGELTTTRVPDQAPRKYVHRHATVDPALQFVDDYHQEQLSYGTTSQPNSYSLRNHPKDERVSKTREMYLLARSRNEVDAPGKKNLAQHYEEMRVRRNSTQNPGALLQGVVISRDPDESLSSVETPSASSVQDLKKQLWNDKEVLQVSNHSVGRLDQKLAQNQRPSRSISPARRIAADTTFDSDNTASFKSKYYEAAMAARGTSNIKQPRGVSPVHSSVTTARRRTNSGGEETQVSSMTSPYDEGGRTRMRSSSRGKERPPSLSMSALHSSFEEGAMRRSANTYHRPPLRHETARTIPDVKEGSRPTRPQSPAMEKAGGGRNSETTSTRSRSKSRDRQRAGSQPRRRSPSPLIKQRVRDFSQEPRGRTPSRAGSVNSRSYSYEPRVKNQNLNSSFDRLAREYEQEVSKSRVRRSSETVQPPPQNKSKAPSNFPYGSETALPDKTIRRITTIRDANTKRDPALEERPPTPINRSMPADTPPSPEMEENEERPKQHAEVAAYWHEKARVSSTLPMPNAQVAHRNRSSENVELARQEVAVGQEPGDNHIDPRNVVDLVAKLSAVNRANPAEALVQIDSILRQEIRGHTGVPENDSRDSPRETRQQEYPNPFDDHETQSQMDDYSDDETSVSSITNPTFQSTSKMYHDQVRVLSPEESPFGAEQERKGPAQVFPSTSTFRRPRPSGLQNYVPGKLQPDSTKRCTHEEGKSMKRARERREEMRKHPPPLTINFRDAQDSASPVLQPEPHPSPVEDRSKVNDTQARNEWYSRSPSPLPTPGFDERVRVTVTHQDDRNGGQVMKDKMPQSPTRPDGILLNKVGFDEKIKTWDTSSSNVREQKVRSESRKAAKAIQNEEPNQKDPQQNQYMRKLPTRTNSNRPHPWDDGIPARAENVDVRETSTENAAGLEAVMHYRKTTKADDNMMRSKEQVSPKPARTHEARPITKRQGRRDQSLLEAFPDDPAIFFDAPTSGGASAPPERTPSETRPNPGSAFDAWTSFELDGDIVPVKRPAGRPRRPDPPRPQPQWETINTGQEYNYGLDARCSNMSPGGFIAEKRPVDSERANAHRTDPAKEHLRLGKSENQPKANSEFDAWTSAVLAGDFASGKQSTTGRNDPQMRTRQTKSQPTAASREVPVVQFDPPRSPPTPWLPPLGNDRTHDLDRNRGGPADLDESSDSAASSQGTQSEQLPEWLDDTALPKSDVEHGAIEVSLLSYDDVLDTSADTTYTFDLQKSQQGGAAGTVQNKSRRRGFLRAFMRKDKKQSKAPPNKGTGNVAVANPGAQSAPASDLRAIPTIRLQPLSPAYFPGDPAPLERGRPGQRFGNQAQQRPRSASLERFRSSNMAQKFGRVMRLYDQD